MIEIRIPKEIKNYREKFFFGLTVRQCVCAAIALLLCVPLYIFGGKFLPQELISWLVLIVAAPLMLVGFFRYNDMTFEKFAVEWVYFQFFPQKRVYSYEPIFMELRKTYLAEELAAEAGSPRGQSHPKFKNNNFLILKAPQGAGKTLEKRKNDFIKKLLKRRKNY